MAAGGPERNETQDAIYDARMVSALAIKLAQILREAGMPAKNRSQHIPASE
jgi:hypothetical protein